MNYKIAKTVGLNTDQQAAQASFNELDQDNGFLAVLDLTCDDAFTKGRQSLADLQDFFLEEEGTPAEKLTKTFEKAKNTLKDCEKFSVLLACVSGKVLYLACLGDVKAILKRDNSFSSLLGEGTGQLVSGFLESGDKVLFATSGLASFLGDDLKRSLNLSLTDWEDEITSRITNPDIKETEIDGGMSGLVLSAEDEVSVEESINPEPPKDFEEVERPSISNISSMENTPPRASIFSKIKNAKNFLPTNKRSRLILAAVLVVILVFGMGLKFKMNKDKETKTKVEAFISQATDDLNTSTGLRTLNPQESDSKLASAKDKVTEALALNSKDSKALELKQKIADAQNSNQANASSSQFDVFLDLNLIKAGFTSTALSLDSGVMVILDPTNKTLVQFNVSKKSNDILGGKEQLGEASIASIFENVVFAYSSDKGVLRVDASNQKISSISKADSDLKQVVDIAGFGGNVYLLDSGSNKIWKYLPTSSGYSDKREYLIADTKADLGNAIKMRIDSSVYVLKQTGEILRFTKGVADNFSFSGLDKGVKDPKSFYVSADTENLYILDSGNSRLLVLGKTGEYKKQYLGDKFATATDLVVDEEMQKAYILDGSKIYQIDLK